MALARSSKSAKPSKIRLAKYGFRALMVARRVRAGMPKRRREEEPTRRGPSKKVIVLGLVAAIVGLYLLRNRIPGPWRSKSAIDEGGVAPPESAPAGGEKPHSDDGEPAPKIAVA